MNQLRDVPPRIENGGEKWNSPNLPLFLIPLA